MKYPKSHYRKIALPVGYVWGGFDNNRHFFVREIKNPNEQISGTEWKLGGRFYETLECTDECLENGNAEWMARHGYTFPSTEDHP